MRGRPKKDDCKNTVFRFRTDGTTNSMLELLSSITGYTKSDVIRMALVSYFNEKVGPIKDISKYKIIEEVQKK